MDGNSSPGIAAFPTISLCSPVSLEQCGSWGQAEGQVLTQNWQGVSGDLLGSAGKSKYARAWCVSGRSDPALGPVAIKQSPREEGTEGAGTAVGGAVVLPEVPCQE